MAHLKEHKTNSVKIYHGYGHKDNLIVFGHVLAGKPNKPRKEYSNTISNIFHLVRLFIIKPVQGAKVQLVWGKQVLYTETRKDGFFKFEWQSVENVPAGWHELQVNLLNEENEIIATGTGKIFVPHSTQYGFISDIDDTILISHSATTGKRIRTLFTKNPKGRKTFADVVKFYQLLANTHTTPDVPNPFFYVSSSEWNLYDDLNEFFKINEIPKGAFLLSDIKNWTQLLKSGKTKHQGKLIRVVRIMEAFPKQRFILIGDNSQKDPEIYAGISNKYPEKIVAVYIRNVRKENQISAQQLLDSIQNKSIQTFQFDHTDDAIQHAKSIGLL